MEQALHFRDTARPHRHCPCLHFDTGTEHRAPHVHSARRFAGWFRSRPRLRVHRRGRGVSRDRRAQPSLHRSRGPFRRRRRGRYRAPRRGAAESLAAKQSLSSCSSPRNRGSHSASTKMDSCVTGCRSLRSLAHNRRMPHDLRSLGTAITPEMIGGTISRFATLHSREIPQGVDDQARRALRHI